MHIEVSDVGRSDARAWLRRGLLLLGVCWWCNGALALTAAEAQELLEQADRMKIGQPVQFAALLDRVSEAGNLPSRQRDYLKYLRGYQASFQGKFDEAIPLLESVTRESEDATLRFRAAATIANVQAVATRYEQAYAQLRPLLDLLPQITDPAARQQGMAVAAYLYNQVGEYGLALNYADRIIAESWGNGACRGAQLRVEAMYRSGTADASDPEFKAGADTCMEANEPAIASAIRVHHARLLIDRGHTHEALQILTEHYDPALQTHYPRLIAEFNAILSQAWLQKGDVQRARQFAMRTIEQGVQDEPTEPLVIAYQTLYEAARTTGDDGAALSWHEKFASADKGYLDELSSRRLAYERIRHETEHDRLQAETLGRRQQVQTLQEQLSRKSAELKVLYAALGLAALALIGLWIYRVRRAR